MQFLGKPALRELLILLKEALIEELIRDQMNTLDLNDD